jgi:hypothetical protein
MATVEWLGESRDPREGSVVEGKPIKTYTWQYSAERIWDTETRQWLMTRDKMRVIDWERENRECPSGTAIPPAQWERCKSEILLCAPVFGDQPVAPPYIWQYCYLWQQSAGWVFYHQRINY